MLTYADRDAIGQFASFGDFRKDLTIEVYNEAGMKVIAYRVYRAWVSEFRSMSELDDADNGFGIESITLQNKGWERDDSIADVAEPSFILPAGNPPA